jgi:hypothetical protein
VASVYREPGPGGWESIEVEDGAAALFPWLDAR